MNNEKTMNTDVLVVGGGPAGFAAAYTAASHGANVVLVEQSGDIGGVSTTGLMSHWTGSCGSPLYHEILKRSAEKNEGEYHNRITQYIDPEKLKTLYLEMLCEVNCKILLYTFADDAIMDGDKIIGITAVNKSGRYRIFANTVVDSTGDGDIAAGSGAEYFKGRENDEKMQPMTIMFKLGGVDTKNAAFLPSFETLYETPNGELQALAKENLTLPLGHVLLYPSTLPGIVTCNMTNCTNVDGTKAEDLTKATVICREQMDKIVDFLRNFAPGYKNCFIISSASVVGVRETRHFAGKEKITEQDILSARVFDNWVVRDAHFDFDVHNMSGAGLDETGMQKKFPQKQGYTIPFGCLLPVKVENLLLSGRNISGTHLAHSSFRVMPICVGTGEAAGAAAALRTKNNCTLNEVSPAEIRKIIYGIEQ